MSQSSIHVNICSAKKQFVKEINCNKSTDQYGLAKFECSDPKLSIKRNSAADQIAISYTPEKAGTSIPTASFAGADTFYITPSKKLTWEDVAFTQGKSIAGQTVEDFRLLNCFKPSDIAPTEPAAPKKDEAIQEYKELKARTDKILLAKLNEWYSKVRQQPIIGSYLRNQLGFKNSNLTLKQLNTFVSAIFFEPKYHDTSEDSRLFLEIMMNRDIAAIQAQVDKILGTNPSRPSEVAMQRTKEHLNKLGFTFNVADFNDYQQFISELKRIGKKVNIKDLITENSQLKDVVELIDNITQSTQISLLEIFEAFEASHGEYMIHEGEISPFSERNVSGMLIHTATFKISEMPKNVDDALKLAENFYEKLHSELSTLNIDSPEQIFESMNIEFNLVPKMNEESEKAIRDYLNKRSFSYTIMYTVE